ncbi:MAG: NAD(P)H-dependent oxidoreductase subunit E, partial [Rubrivivax sp.]
MNTTVIPIAPAERQRKRQAPKGRQVQPQAVQDLLDLLGDGDLRRDRLIEYLHAVQDHFGQLGTPHLAALAQRLRLAQAEVFEVASFYHHFDVVHEDATGQVPAPPALTVRVCDGLSCQMAGAAALLDQLPALLGPGVRVLPAPCVGRCEQAPAAVVHQHPLAQATPAAVQSAVA